MKLLNDCDMITQDTEEKIVKIILVIFNIGMFLFGAIFGGPILMLVLIILGILDLIYYFVFK